MHTYLKMKTGYSVGQWLPRKDGVMAFCELFTVSALSEAITAANVLNGGDGAVMTYWPKDLKEREPT